MPKSLDPASHSLSRPKSIPSIHPISLPSTQPLVRLDAILNVVWEDDADKIVGEVLGNFKIDCDEKDIKKGKNFVSNYNGGGHKSHHARKVGPPCIEDLKMGIDMKLKQER